MLGQLVAGTSPFAYTQMGLEDVYIKLAQMNPNIYIMKPNANRALPCCSGVTFELLIWYRHTTGQHTNPKRTLKCNTCSLAKLPGWYRPAGHM